MVALKAFLRNRAGLLALLLASLGTARVAGPALPPATLAGLSALLGRAVAGTVRHEDLAWEPSSGFFWDAMLGRGVFFLASPLGGGPRDLHRARVRLGLDGRPARVTAVHNLTRTPLGDDAGLQVHGRTAAVATSAYGRIQGVSVFEFGGIGTAEGGSWADRVRSRWSSWRQTGALGVMKRVDVVVEVPRASATLSLGADVLKVALGEGDPGIIVDLRGRTAEAVGGGAPDGASVLFRPTPSKPFIAWAVDELRAIVGPAWVARLEHRLFGAQDSIRRVVGATFGAGQALRAPSPARQERHDVTWPPPAIASLFAVPAPGEGEWKPIERSWLPAPAGLASSGPAYFQKTFIRPDTERPYAEVHLVAMDMRQLEVSMVAGYEDPEPLVGPPGRGSLPPEPEEYRRVAAVFNGAFKTAHGEYGMMVDRRVIVPPVPGAATVVSTHDAELGFGTWPESKALPGEVVSFRQNLDPLVAGGVPNPTRRQEWGWQIAGEDVHTERTALCVTGAGQVLYAWGNAVSGPLLARALVRAGCDYAVHLDMNPTHCGFVLTGIEDLERHTGELELVHPDMRYPKLRAVAWSPKDFFYVRVRDATPPPVLGATWTRARAQPDPSWLPGLFTTRVRLGELEFKLLSFEKGRFDWVVRAGEREPSVTGAAPKKTALSGADAARALVGINLGRTTTRTSYGLAFGAKPSLELRRAYATLVLSPGRSPRVVPPGEVAALDAGTEAVQLPTIAMHGDVTAAARRRGARRVRAGVCITPFGRVLYAEVEHDSDDPIATVLLAAGCRDVLSTDRGSKHAAFAHLPSEAPPSETPDETSLLHALSRPARPRAFAWRPVTGSD